MYFTGRVAGEESGSPSPSEGQLGMSNKCWPAEKLISHESIKEFKLDPDICEWS